MSIKTVLSGILNWRWLPFVLPVAGTVIFVGAAVLFIPSSLQGEGEESDGTDSTLERAESETRAGASQRKRTSTQRLGSSKSPAVSRAPHNARIRPPRTGPGRSTTRAARKITDDGPGTAPVGGPEDEQ